MKTILLLICFLFSTKSYSWDGYDYDRSSFIEIEKGNLVREGEEIEFFDWSKGEYGSLEIDEVDSYGGNVIVEGTDSYGIQRRFEMN